jgi:hypothetical protein
MFISTIHAPQGEKHQHFYTFQKTVHKDVKYYFDGLQSKCQIMTNPYQLWDCNVIAKCIDGMCHITQIDNQR